MTFYIKNKNLLNWLSVIYRFVCVFGLICNLPAEKLPRALSKKTSRRIYLLLTWKKANAYLHTEPHNTWADHATGIAPHSKQVFLCGLCKQVLEKVY